MRTLRVNYLPASVHHGNHAFEEKEEIVILRLRFVSAGYVEAGYL